MGCRNVRLSGLLFTAFLCGSGEPIAKAGEPSRPNFEWQEVAPGIEAAEYRIGGGDTIFSAPVILVKVDPSRTSFLLVESPPPGSDLRTLTRAAGGTVGINANFFDDSHRPLGLVASGGTQRRPLQRGGNTLTGVFLINKQGPAIVHRDDYDPAGVKIAVQAGPRLIENGRALPVRSDQETNRRSGVAVTADGSVVLFATMLRFPGASFDDLLKMLLDPRLQIRDALNFDGGSSSQLFIERSAGRAEEVFVNGGDSVPVGIVVRAKEVQ